MQVISKKIDKLGRIVVPIGYRRILDLTSGTKVILGIEGNSITVRSVDATCKLCGSSADVSKHLGVCSECVRKIKRC